MCASSALRLRHESVKSIRPLNFALSHRSINRGGRGETCSVATISLDLCISHLIPYRIDLCRTRISARQIFLQMYRFVTLISLSKTFLEKLLPASPSPGESFFTLIRVAGSTPSRGEQGTRRARSRFYRSQVGSPINPPADAKFT